MTGPNLVPGGAMPASSDVYFANPDKLTNATVLKNWWVSGGSEYPASYAARVELGLTFSNGQLVRISQEGSINMWRPKSKIDAATGAVAVDDNFIRQSGAKGLGLHYGVVRPYGTPGILSRSSNPLRGEFSWVQKIISFEAQYRNNRGEAFHVQDIDGLDGFLPYPAPDGEHEDSPGMSIDPEQFGTTWLHIADSFDTWLEFRPDSSSQWVPLRKIHWEWSGDAAAANGTWILNNPHDIPNQRDAEEEEYPTWTHIIDLTTPNWQQDL